MKLLNYVILLFLIPNFGLAQKKTNTLLWEVSHPNSNYKSYLLGTFHEVNPDFLAQNCFVAVGVKHLYYKQGLIASLREAGFQVTPVFTNVET